MRRRRRRIGATALVAAAIFLVALLLAVDRTPRSEARLLEIDATKIHYASPFRDLLEPRTSTEPYTPLNIPSAWRSHEKASWRWGYRNCRKSWHDLVVAAGLTGFLPSSGPESQEQLEWLAWRLLYSGGLELPEVNTDNFNYGVQGCLDGFRSYTKSGSTRGGIDEAP
jgi:hypothetical protein